MGKIVALRRTPAPTHTEGPWQSYSFEYDPWVIIGALDGPDDGIFHFTEACTINECADEAEANRKLIVAAPALATALQGVIAIFDANPDDHARFKEWCAAQIFAARAVLDKAGVR
jgi:hypothetical protein